MQNRQPTAGQCSPLTGCSFSVVRFSLAFGLDLSSPLGDLGVMAVQEFALV
jgi:hypothetical protein